MSSSPPPSSSAKPMGWNPIVITAVGLVCSIFLIFSYYRFFRRNCSCFQNERFSRTTSFRRRFLNHGLESPDNDVSSQMQSRGLDSFLMHSIPITQFKKKIERDLEKGNGMDCAICLGEFEEDEWVKNLPNCCHVFHVACIDTWFQTHSSCPLCRSCIDDMAMHDEYGVSIRTLIENMRSDDLVEEGSRQNETLQTQMLHSSFRSSMDVARQ